jgi:hypothetical protein
MPRLLRPTPWLTALLFLLALALYTITLAPSVVTLFDDSLEFQLVAWQLGIAHPTGYPLYILLGKLFTLLPLGNVAYRVNWLSAVCGAATVALLYRLILLAAPPRSGRAIPPAAAHAGAVAGALLFAVGPIFWAQATIAEVYTLNALFVALLLGLALSRPPMPGTLYLLAFIGGLSLTHHRTMVLLAPGLLLCLLLSESRAALFRPKTLGLAALFFLLPLLLYLYLPLRGHIGSLDGTYQNTPAGFWRQISASGYGAFIFGNPFAQARPPDFYLNLLADQFYTTVLGLIGLLYLLRWGRGAIIALTGVTFLTYFTFNVFYNVADIEVFFIPVFLLWAIWSGVGATFLLGTALSLRRPGWRWPAVGLLAIILAVMIGQVARAGYAGLNYTWAVHDYGIDMLRQPVPDDAAVVGIVGEMTLLRYFQQTEGLRPTLEPIAADAEAERLAVVARLLAEHRPVYLTRDLPGAAQRWSLAAVGPLIRVNPTPVTALPPEATPANLPAAPDITLAGYAVERVPHTGPGPAPLRLTAYWQPAAPIPADWKVSARLLAADGTPAAVVDAAPVHFAYPTPAWRPGEIIADGYDLPLPPDFAAGSYTPLLIWYNPAQNAAEVGRVELPPLVIE